MSYVIGIKRMLLFNLSSDVRPTRNPTGQRGILFGGQFSSKIVQPCARSELMECRFME